MLELLLALLLPVWLTKSPLPRGEAGAAVARSGGSVVVAGGTYWEDGTKRWLNEVQVYDARSDRWRKGPALPEPLAYGPFVGDALEVFGGSHATGVSRRIWRLDASLQKWTAHGETPGDHALGRAARVGRRVFLFGGCADLVDLTRCSDTVWMREGEGPWQAVAKLPGGSVVLSAVAVWRGRVWLFGGCQMKAPGALENRAEAWAFHPSTFAFERRRDLPSANRGITALAVRDAIWLFGGYTAGFTDQVWRYDPRRNAYAKQTALPVALSSIEFVALGKQLLGVGGEDRMRSRSARTFLWDGPVR
ncbi:MAG: hypothetical protein K2X03_14240 [Bryobacteraceae bacterium]|nr:hypothetical protein [Bryobacteraceae bacterium]